MSDIAIPKHRNGNAITCSTCGTPLAPKRGSRRQRYCGRACKRAGRSVQNKQAHSMARKGIALGTVADAFKSTRPHRTPETVRSVENKLGKFSDLQRRFCWSRVDSLPAPCDRHRGGRRSEMGADCQFRRRAFLPDNLATVGACARKQDMTGTVSKSKGTAPPPRTRLPADIARAIRAAKQAGAAEVEVRVGGCDHCGPPCSVHRREKRRLNRPRKLSCD